MQKTVAFIVFGAAALILTAAATPGQAPPQVAPPTIENPDKPAAPNPGRVLALKEVMRIRDDGKNFYFKEPWGIDVASDGSILVMDGLRLFEFDFAGKFQRDLVHTGQGPGEISTELTGFLIEGSEVSLFSGTSAKLVVTGLDGKFIREIRLRDRLFSMILARHGSQHLMLDSKFKDLDRSLGLKDLIWSLFIADQDGTLGPTGLFFLTKMLYSLRAYGQRSSRSLDPISKVNASVRHENSIFIAHSQEYLIEEVDLEKTVVVRSFRRAYPRVKYHAKDPRDTRPMPAYENDIHRLLIFGNNVWAVTSTFDPQKGVLVDVFDSNGKFRDSFVLPVVNSRTGDCFYQRYFPLVIRDGFLYAVEHDADWNWSIAKYELPKL